MENWDGASVVAPFPLSLVFWSAAIEGAGCRIRVCLRLAVGSALLALWVHARFPKLAPEHVGKTLLPHGGRVRPAPADARWRGVAGDRLRHDRPARRAGPQLRAPLLNLDAAARPVCDGRLAQRQHVAGLDPAAGALPARELDDRLRPAPAGRPPADAVRARQCRSRRDRCRGRSHRSRIDVKNM